MGLIRVEVQQKPDLPPGRGWGEGSAQPAAPICLHAAALNQVTECPFL